MLNERQGPGVFDVDYVFKLFDVWDPATVHVVPNDGAILQKVAEIEEHVLREVESVKKSGGPGSATIVLMPRAEPDLQRWPTPDFLMLSLDFALVSSAGEDRGLVIHNRAPSTARFFSCRISDFRLSDSRKSLKCPNSRSLSAHLIYFPARGTGVADSGIQAVLRRCIFALT